jgi:hypothetical protein
MSFRRDEMRGLGWLCMPYSTHYASHPFVVLRESVMVIDWVLHFSTRADAMTVSWLLCSCPSRVWPLALSFLTVSRARCVWLQQVI